MDKILESYLKEFKNNFGLPDIGNDTIFEKFATYCALYKELPKFSISVEDLNSVDTGKYRGIDSVVFILNGRLISSINDLKELFSVNNTIRVKVIFLQSKLQNSINENDIRGFGDLIGDFLSEEPKFDLSPEAKELHNWLLYIYENFTKVEKFEGKGYFCYSGKYLTNHNIDELLKEYSGRITSEGSFKNSEFSLRITDREELIKLYDKTKNMDSVEFEFIYKQSIEGIPNVDEAYIGFLPYEEFKKILVDNDGNIRNLFYDNVRDFLGLNDIKVNRDIKKTLETEPHNFVVLNNGVTIIAEANEGKGNKFKLKNFQIVNGCQTSNIIYEVLYKGNGNPENLKVPVKLIITSNEEIKNKIIMATNNQTEIPEEQLEALTQFQKNLEKFYNSVSKELPIKVYYERRIHKYSGSSILKKEILNIREQIKLFSSVFLEVPHIASASYSKVLREKKENIFRGDHRYEPYVMVGILNNYFRYFLDREIDRKFNKARYHLFLMFRIIYEDFIFKTHEISSQRKMEKYFEPFLDIFKDSDSTKNALTRVCELMEESNIDLSNQKEFYKPETTRIVVKLATEFKIDFLDKRLEKLKNEKQRLSDKLLRKQIEEKIQSLQGLIHEYEERYIRN
ncbi:AIPR family protein [Desulfurobacterium sp.]